MCQLPIYFAAITVSFVAFSAATGVGGIFAPRFEGRGVMLIKVGNWVYGVRGCTLLCALGSLSSVMRGKVYALGLGGRPVRLCTPVRCVFSVNKGEVEPELTLLTTSLFASRLDSSVVCPTLKVRVFRTFALVRSSVVSGTSVHHKRPAMCGG